MSVLDSFRRDGVVVVSKALGDNVVDAALEQIESFREANRAWLAKRELLLGGHLFRVIDLHLLLPSLRAMLYRASPEALAVADSIAGKAALYTSLYFELGSEQPHHRDTPYFWTSPPYAYGGMWVALEDADAGNGALSAIPGSHLLGEPDLLALRRKFCGEGECPPSHTPLFDAYNAAVLDMALAKGLQARTYEIGKGDVILWNASTLHGGGAHHDKTRTRKSFVMHITPRGVPVNHMNYFFHPERKQPASAPWGYFTEQDREFANHNHVGFMHKADFTVDQFDGDHRLIQSRQD